MTHNTLQLYQVSHFPENVNQLTFINGAANIFRSFFGRVAGVDLQKQRAINSAVSDFTVGVL